MAYTCDKCGKSDLPDSNAFLQHLSICPAFRKAQEELEASRARRAEVYRIRELATQKEMADAIRSAMQTFGGGRPLAPRDMFAGEGFICDQSENSFSNTDALFQHFGSCIEIRKAYEALEASRAQKAKISTPISQLPREMIGKIFSYLEIQDILICAKTCKQWGEIAAHLYLQPFLLRLSNYDRMERYWLREFDWSKDCSDSELISTLFESIIINYYGRVITVKSFPNIAEVIDLLDPNFRQTVSFEVSGSLTGKEYYWCKGFLMGDKILLHGYDFIDDIDFLCVLGQSKVGIRFTAKERLGASGIIKIDESTLLRVGGCFDSNAMDIIHFDPLNEENQFMIKEGPEFPYEIYGHAMIQHIPGEIHVIGGRIFDDTTWKATNKTWIIDTKNQFSVTEGPELCLERSHHSVGVMDPGWDHAHIIVVGGSSKDTDDPDYAPEDPSDFVLKSTEFLDDVRGKWEFIFTTDYEKLEEAVKEEPFNPDRMMDVYSLEFVDEPIMEMAMIQSPDRCGVVLFGTGKEGNNLKELRKFFNYKPPDGGYYGEWINLEQSLEFTERTQVAIPIPYGFRLSTIKGKDISGVSDQGSNH